MKITYILLAVSCIFSNLYSAERSNHLITRTNATPNRCNNAYNNTYYDCVDGLKYCVKLPEELDCDRQEACFWCCATGCTIPTVALCQAGKITASILYSCLYPGFAMTMMNTGGIEVCDFLCDTIGNRLNTWAKTPTERQNHAPQLPSMTDNNGKKD